MLGLMQTEIYGSKGVINGLHSAIKDAMALQLTRNIGVIAPNQMEPEMLQLKVNTILLNIHSVIYYILMNYYYYF